MKKNDKSAIKNRENEFYDCDVGDKHEGEQSDYCFIHEWEQIHNRLKHEGEKVHNQLYYRVKNFQKKFK